jgi:hypothetical protein
MGAKHPAQRHQPILRTHQTLKKKLQWHTTFGMIDILAQVMRDGNRGALRHPFRDFAKVSNRCASLTLQRRISDFAAERSFHQTATALREHYRIEVPLYTIDKATAAISREAKHFNSKAPADIKPAKTLISEVDGSMLPIVGFSDAPPIGPDGKRPDKRKLRHCHWKEIRVATTRVPGSVETWYGVALGEPLSVGCMMSECAKFKGLHSDTHIHAIADGASWISEQYDRHFGTRCKFHVDFWHVCQYLSAAAKSTAMNSDEREIWLESQKQSLLASEAKAVIAALESLIPLGKDGDESCPVGTAISYLKKRAHQLDYREAIRQKLPIGSGEVESAHRHILQKRLKIPGAWWRQERAEEMAQLRAMRANQRWNDFWIQKAA